MLPAAAVVLALQLVRDPSVEWPAAGFGAALFLFLAALAYPRGMGMGDVKLALLLGVGVGRSRAGRALRRDGLRARPVGRAVRPARLAARKMAIPFAPFLALGGVSPCLPGARSSTGTGLR